MKKIYVETSSKEKPKAVEGPKQEYIHVRARRGQATDSHSLAERMFEVPAVAYSAEVANSAYIQVNSLLEMGNNPIDAMLRRSIGGPVSIPETFVVSSCFNQMQPGVTWDGDLHNLYRMEIQQESSTIPFQPHKFTGKKSINLYTYFFPIYMYV
ncbi:putative basic helix-loop-helix leucine zipper transcription factor [Helianthus annuus]|nr:putative basic helix-loop-helix leucine zipper transcription factor [Helianthus annuus]